MLAAYSLLLHWTGLRADLAESNLQSNLIRISSYLHESPAPVALVGSSVAGRLLPQYFQEDGVAVQNLGLDGSRPLFAFEIVRMRDPLPSSMLVDISALFQPLMSNDDTLRDSVRSPTFAAARWFPLLRPTYRISSLLYARVKRYRDTRGGGIQQPSDSPCQSPPPVSKIKSHHEWLPENQFLAVRTALSEFRSAGTDVRLLSIPSGGGWGNRTEGLTKRLSDELGLEMIDLGPDMAKEGKVLRFSDGLHLDVPSAKIVASEISRQLKQKSTTFDFQILKPVSK